MLRVCAIAVASLTQNSSEGMEAYSSAPMHSNARDAGEVLSLMNYPAGKCPVRRSIRQTITVMLSIPPFELAKSIIS